MRSLILASSSPYRKALLERFGFPFTAISPDLDERPYPEETPLATTVRLARAKAEVIQAQHPGSVIIGSDQLASLGSMALGKPGTLDLARQQLQKLSGQVVTFYTALAVIDDAKKDLYECVVPCEVKYRDLNLAEIDRYLAREPAIDCAGSAKVEALGITLMEYVRSDDPSALTGLPLIKTAEFLRASGFVLP